MRDFFTGLTHRNGEVSTKKIFYGVAGAASTFIIVYEALKLPTPDGMDDWAFIWLFAIYLVTVGGFDVILEMMRLVISFKNGTVAPTVKVVEETNKKTTTTEAGQQPVQQ
jgi:hypothetical protein